MTQLAQMHYYPEQKSLEISVPHGLTFEEFGESGAQLLSEELLKRLKVACPGCFSGISLRIRERFDPFVDVDLHKLATMRPGGIDEAVIQRGTIAER